MAPLTKILLGINAVESTTKVRAGIAAARVRTLPAAIGPVLVGSGLAWADDQFIFLPFLAALVAAILIQVGTNYANDYSDFVRGVDTEARLGDPRMTQTGQLTAAAVRGGAALSFALAIVIGTYLVWRGGWPVVTIGLASIAAGICYTGGPWPFGYHGLGDLFVMVFFGPIAVAGTYYVQALNWNHGTLLAGLGVGALTTAILVVNNLRDHSTDRVAGKRTLTVFIGKRSTQIEYTLLLLIAAAVPVLGTVWFDWPILVLLSLGALVAVGSSLRIVWTYEDPRELNSALAATAGTTGAYGFLFALGCIW